MELLFFLSAKTFERTFKFMTNIDKTAELQLLLCEMKLEQRRLNTSMSHLIKQNKTIDFFKAKQLNSQKTGLAKRITKIESRIDPNIIA